MSERSRAADSFVEIRARIAELKLMVERVEMCPVHISRPLAECLRSSARCGDACPLRADWIGPQT